MRIAAAALLCAAVVACGGTTRRSEPTTAGSPARAAPAADGCPLTPGGRRARGVSIALGDGPAYPVLGMQAAPPGPLGVAELADDIHRRGVYLHKTLWALRPGIDTDLTVRAETWPGGDPVRFSVGPVLHLARAGDRWSYGVTNTRFPGPGCYAFRLYGRGIDERIVFRAAMRAERPLLFLAGDRETWVVDVAAERVRRLRMPGLGPGDPPERVLRRRGSIVVMHDGVARLDPREPGRGPEPVVA